MALKRPPFLPGRQFDENISRLAPPTSDAQKHGGFFAESALTTSRRGALSILSVIHGGFPDCETDML